MSIFLAVVWNRPWGGAGPAAAAAGETPSSPLSELLRDAAGQDYPKAIGPRAFSFPQDHGPHPGFRNEWWYVTGNVDAASGRRFGFELTIFRFRLAPADADETAPASAWRSNQVFIAHFAVTDVAERRFLFSQRYARDALGLAGAQARPFRVWLEDWSMQDVAAHPAGWSPDDSAIAWRLRAADRDIGIDLRLDALKAPVLNGVNGLSQKSSDAGDASYYYSVSRLRSQGSLRLGEKQYPVTGLAWLDREWGSSALSREQRGWDWFALQLSDGSELMFYKLRRNDGSQDSRSAGSWIAVDGQTMPLSSNDVAIEVRDRWHSPQGGEYPIDWYMRVMPLALQLHVSPVIAAQEFGTGIRYWEGAVDVAGRRNGAPITGRGYVELTGYAATEAPAAPGK